MENGHFLTAFLVCLVGYIIHTAAHYAEYKGKWHIKGMKTVCLRFPVVII